MIRPTVRFGLFEWDLMKEIENKRKHGVDFTTAAKAFLDPNRIVAIRIIGAGQWRKGAKLYENKTKKN